MAFIKKCEGHITTCCLCPNSGTTFIDNNWYCSKCAPVFDNNLETEEQTEND